MARKIVAVDRPAAWSLVVAFALVAAGCGTEDDVGPAAYMSGCHLSATLTLTIGGFESPFGNISDVGRLPDGSIAVSDRIGGGVAIFDADGEYLRKLGREGRGPGEFLDPIAVAATDGALLVWDWDQQRVTTFDLNSDDLDTYRVDGLANLTHHFGDVPAGFVVGSKGFPDMQPGARSWTSEIAVVRWDSVRSVLDTIVAFEHETSQWVDESIRLAGSATFSPEGTFAAGDGRIYWTEGDSAVINVWENGTTRRIAWDWPERTVTSGDVDLYLERWLTRTPEENHEHIRKQIETMPVAEVFPTVADLVHDVDGGVWAGIYPTPSDTTQTWLRFEDEQVDCRLELPRSFEPTEGARDWLVGIGTNELDVERVESWSIEYD